MQNLLRNVQNMKPSQPSQPSAASNQRQQTAAANPPSPPSGAARASEGPDRAFKPSGQAIDAIRGQVSKNWNFDSGRKDANSMVVEIRIEVARDHQVIKAEIDPQYLPRYRSDSAFRASADAAIRAIMRSSPLQLLPQEFTADTYDKWRTIVFKFDPRDMF